MNGNRTAGVSSAKRGGSGRDASGKRFAAPASRKLVPLAQPAGSLAGLASANAGAGKSGDAGAPSPGAKAPPSPHGGEGNSNTRLPDGLRLVVGRRRIARRLKEMAAAIAARIDPSERPVAVIVLQGAFVFAADLLRQFPPGYTIDVAFVRCESYGAGTRSSGRVLLRQDLDPDLDLRGRTVLLVDDILDTGLTLEFLNSHLLRRGAARVQICVLLERQSPGGSRQEAGGRRREAVGRRQSAAGSRQSAADVCPPRSRIEAQFAGFDIGPEFVVGYGLDHAGRYRNLPDLAALPPAGCHLPPASCRLPKGRRP